VARGIAVKNVTIHDSYFPPSEADLNAIERQLGVTLPLEYRAFLLSCNGGYPEPSAFSILRGSNSEWGVINRFFAVHGGEYDDLLEHAEMYRERVPPDLLQIANDPGGNLICISVSGANLGKVFFWSHEEEADEGEPPSYENLHFVANSFHELLDSLVDLPEEDSG
jgi:hypothetical protein